MQRVRLARTAGTEVRAALRRLAAALLWLPTLVAGTAGAASSSYLLPDILDNSYQYAISTAGGGAVMLGPETLVRLDDAGLPIWAARPPGTRPLASAQPFGLRDGDVVIANITPPGAGQAALFAHRGRDVHRVSGAVAAGPPGGRVQEGGGAREGHRFDRAQRR